MRFRAVSEVDRWISGFHVWREADGCGGSLTTVEERDSQETQDRAVDLRSTGSDRCQAGHSSYLSLVPYPLVMLHLSETLSCCTVRYGVFSSCVLHLTRCSLCTACCVKRHPLRGNDLVWHGMCGTNCHVHMILWPIMVWWYGLAWNIYGVWW